MTLLSLAEEPSSWPGNRRQAQQAQKLTSADRSRRVLGRPLASWLGVGCCRSEPVGSLSWHRRALLVVATRLCWSERSESCDDFMKFGLSSSGCESRPTKAEPGRSVVSLAVGSAMARLMRRQTNKWAAGMQPRNGSSREAQGVTNPEGSRRRHRYRARRRLPRRGGRPRHV